MPAASLFDTVSDNHGLFSNYFLEHRLPDRDDFEALTGEADAALEHLLALYQTRRAELEGANEAQTEERFIKPVLDALGWAWQVQAHAQAHGRRGRPDYALFTTDKKRDQAVRDYGADDDRLYSRAAAIADAKYWGRSLDGPGSDAGREAGRKAGRKAGREAPRRLTRENPSFQIVDYFTITGVEWGLLTNGTHWRLYYAGAPSRLETYFEVHLAQLFRLAEGDEDERREAQETFRLFYAFFRAASFRPGPAGRSFLEAVYAASDTYSAELEDALKRRVFDRVFLQLATGLFADAHLRNASRAKSRDLQPNILNDIYRATLRLLYRLLFLLHAEARDLLPVRETGGYGRYSLTRLALEAARDLEKGVTLSSGMHDYWNDLQDLVGVIDGGDADLDVPAYNGGLFRRGAGHNAFLDDHRVADASFVPALVTLTAVDPEGDPAGPRVDYKALDVQQLGSIYEGLLEHHLVLKEDGALALENDRGERKATGSYYTPHYIVEYIARHTLGPVVAARTEQFEKAMERIGAIISKYPKDTPGRRARLKKHRRRAEDAFLTVRVCDPAMGSGHFLVYAADYLAERFGQVLSRYPEHNPVLERLEDIRAEIRAALGRQGVTLAGETRLRDTSLLKRLVMKRCIYGVDLNPMAVELAKLSLWLHSFTVGAPLSFLDHHLKTGNALIGATVEAVKQDLEAEQDQFELFGGPFAGLLQATRLMQTVAHLSDATLGEVQQSAHEFTRYERTVAPYKRLLDLYVSEHFANERARYLLQQFGPQMLDLFRGKTRAADARQEQIVEAARRVAQAKRFFHWELEFPEVFFDLERTARKTNPGFDAVIGNPPYGSTGSANERGFLSENLGPDTDKDLFVAFFQCGLIVVREQGKLGFIAPSSVQTGVAYRDFRYSLLKTSRVRQIVKLPYDIFKDAYIDTSIYLIQKERAAQGDEFVKGSADVFEFGVREDAEAILATGPDFREVEIENWISDENLGFVVDAGIIALRKSLAKLATLPLNQISESARGILPTDSGLASMKRGGKWKAFFTGDVYRYQMIPGNEQWVKYDDNLPEKPSNYKFFAQPRILVRRLINRRARMMATYTEAEWVTKKDLYSLIVNGEYHGSFLLSLLNSRLFSYLYVAQSTVASRDDFPQVTLADLRHLPIRKIAFTTPEDARAAAVEEAVAAYEEAVATQRAASLSTDEDAAPVLNLVDAHLTATPERADVVHDLLAHLAREMTDLHAQRRGYHLDLFDYLQVRDDGPALDGLGRYRPAPGVTDGLLAATTETHDGLRIGRVEAAREDGAVTLRATLRYKPEAADGSATDGSAADQWGYVETGLIDAFALRDLSDEEAMLVAAFVPAVAERGDGTAGFRAQAAKTITPLDRLHNIQLPAPKRVASGLRRYAENKAQVGALDRRIQLTDALIDQIVYRLYALTEEEAALVSS